MEQTPISKSLYKSLRKHAETEFCNFYMKILCSMNEIPRSEHKNVCKALYIIRNYRKMDTAARPLPEYDEKDFRRAYIFTFCIIHSVVMYNQFLDMLKINPSLQKKIVSMKELKLCILGGGPGFEAVAVCKILSQVKAKFDSGINSVQLHVTLIDNCAEWESEAEYILNSVQKELISDNNENVVINFSFIKADLKKKFSSEVLEAIKKAHFVTMFKFVTEFGHRYGEEKVFRMISRISETMSYKSCLFILDNAGGRLFIDIDKMIEKNPCAARIYGPCLHNCEQLKLETVQLFSVYFENIFKASQCTALTTISSSAWLKIRPPTCVIELQNGLEKLIRKPKKTKGNIKDFVEKNAQLDESP